MVVLADITDLETVKISALTETTTPGNNDVSPTVQSGQTKKITNANLLPEISDVAYSDGWDGDTTAAPSKNAVYDKIDTLSRFHDYTESPILVTGGEFSEGTNAGTLKVTAITALLRDEDSETGTLVYVTKAEEDNISLPAQNTIYLVALNYNSGSPTISLTQAYPNLTQNINIGLVMDNTDTNCFMTGEGGLRLHDFPRRIHLRNIELRASELASGSVPSYTGTNNFTMTAGVIYAGTNRASWGSYDSTADKFVYIYRSNGGGDYTYVPDQTAIDYAHYDDGDGTLGTIGVAKYGVHWIYRTFDGCVHVVYGYAGNYSLEQAEDATAPSIPDFLSAFGLLIGKIIVPYGGGSFTTIQMVTDTFFSGTAVSTHNDLGGLNDGDYKHLTAAAHTIATQAATNAIDGYATSSHIQAVEANTAKTTNATHTGDVTGSGALTISVDAVDIPMLSATGTADASTYLRGDNTWTSPAEAGDVSKVGTPVDNQVGVWTGNGTIEGTSGLTYSGTVLDLTGNITLTGTVDGIDIAADVAANTAKATNVTTNLSEGTSTTTTVDVNSSDGTNATLVAASTTRAGVLTKAKFDEIVVNTAKTGVTDLIDAALSTDHTWTGPTQLITAGENLAIFETAYLKSDGKYWRIDADAEATAKGKIVMATAAINADATGIVLLPGEFSFIRDDSTAVWTVTATGDTMFLSTTIGELTNDISGYTTGDIGRVAGYMETATILNFNVDKTWIKI